MNARFLNLGVLGSLVAVAVVLWGLLASVPKSSAIPAFSRKYQTSCTTCHSNYPELNDFGEAFKKNGFKFPKDDETFVKEPPVLLGSKAQKEAFPGAVYPGEIPGYLPIAFRYSGNFNWNAKQPPAAISTNGGPYSPLVRTDLFVPNTFTIISTGSFGPNLSFWIDDDISAGGTGAGGGLGDGWVKYNDIGRVFHLPLNSLNVRVGQFEPDLPFSQARTYYLSGFDVFSQPVKAQNACAAAATICQTANNPFVLGSPQRGIEFGGTPNNGNFNWSVAYLDGTGSSYGSSPLVTRNKKDVYLRASYKFNLERDPESRHAIQAAGATGPRDHTSIRAGVFYYYGTNQQLLGGIDPAFTFAGTVNEPYYRVGGDLRFKYRHLELFGVGLVGHDDNHLLNTTTTTIVSTRAVTFTGGFAGANYWLYPWLIGTMRYDFVNSPSDFVNLVSQYKTRNAFRPGYQILVRANIKVVGEYQRHWGQPYPDPNSTTGGLLYYRPNTFVSGIDYVF